MTIGLFRIDGVWIVRLIGEPVRNLDDVISNLDISLVISRLLVKGRKSLGMSRKSSGLCRRNRSMTQTECMYLRMSFIVMMWCLFIGPSYKEPLAKSILEYIFDNHDYTFIFTKIPFSVNIKCDPTIIL